MHKAVRFVIHTLGCLCGIALAVYGFYTWKAAGYPNPVRNEEDPPVSGDGALCLSFIGLSLFAYCLFEIVTMGRRYNSDPSDI